MPNNNINIFTYKYIIYSAIDKVGHVVLCKNDESKISCIKKCASIQNIFLSFFMLVLIDKYIKPILLIKY